MAKRKAAASKASSYEENSHGEDPLHPRLTNQLFGHKAAEETFLAAFKSGALHHAWLLTGEEGVGKVTFAYLAARFLLSRGADPTTMPEGAGLALPSTLPAARQISAGAHPSLFVLGGETKAAGPASIGVEAVRKLRAFLSLTSPDGWRVTIVDPANDLTISSANALLKAIEEPPPRTVFFIIAQGVGSVMPTIRSRCLRLSFRRLNPIDFSSAILSACSKLDMAEAGSEETAKLYAAAPGSPGRAVCLMASGLLDVHDKFDRLTERLTALDYRLVHGLIQSVSGARNASLFASVCDLLEQRIEDAARNMAAKSGETVANAVAWAALWQSIRKRRIEMESLNLDKGAFLMAAFSDMERTARNLVFAPPA